MRTHRKTEIAVGGFFITATVASIAGSAALGSALDGTDYLVGLADHEARVIGAVLLFLTAATSAFATAFLLFPILRRHAEGLAAGYVGLRAFENLLYVVGTVALLMMLTVSQSGTLDTTPGGLAIVGTALLALHDWSVSIGTLMFFGVGGTILSYVLYRSVLVPRWLSGWGLVAALMAFAYGLVGLFGADTGLGSPWMLLAMPIAFQEMVFAGWLIIRGLDRGSVTPAPSEQHLSAPEVHSYS